MNSFYNIVNIISDKFDNELSWRKKELVSLKDELEKYLNQNSEELSFLKRGAVALSYAHLEGGVKNLFILYIQFINNLLSENMLSLNENNINEIILDLIFYNRVKKFSQNTREKRLEGLNYCKDFFLNKSVLKIDKKVINTKSNLNFEILKELYLLVGIEMNIKVNMEKNFINKLVERRNAIAHGENSSDDIRIVINSIEKVMIILEIVREDIFNTLNSFKDIVKCN